MVKLMKFLLQQKMELVVQQITQLEEIDIWDI